MPPDVAPDLSVVIPTRRRHEVLPRSLGALESQTVAPERFEVIVVEDAEEDDSLSVAAALDPDRRPFPTQHLRSELAGASAARNVGIRAARGRIVLFIGDDIIVPPDFLEQHLRWHERHPEDEVAVLGRVRWARELRVTPFMRWLEEGTQFDYGSLEGKMNASWTHFYTANVSAKRSFLELVGGFDEERFPFLYEDLDLGYRLAERGLRLLYNPAAEGEHLHQTTIDDWRGRMAAVARSERRWVELHPERDPWFYDLYSTAQSQRRIPTVVGEVAARVPWNLPVGGRRAWAVANQYYRQRLAPAFLDEWTRE